MRPPDDFRLEGPATAGTGRTVDEVLRALLPARTPHGPVLFLGAHPGDVVSGASWWLCRSPGGHVVHVVDGTSARVTEESFRALALAGLAREQLLSLGAREHQAALSLVPLTECLMALLKALRPALLVGPPYAGEHLDDDAAAFISHAAVALMVRAGRTPPVLVEMGGPFPATRESQPEITVSFTEAERVAKQRLLACHGSRESEWRTQPLHRERYRLAPRYDFSRPPREGPLPYETRGRGMTGAHWRQLALQALEELKLPETPWH